MAWFFTSEAHRARFLATIQELGKVYGGRLDPEYGAALYVLTANADTWDKASSYVSQRGIQFNEMLSDQDWSGGHRVLVTWAANLFNSFTPTVGPVELMRLDDGNFQVALTALLIRRREHPLTSFQQQQGEANA